MPSWDGAYVAYGISTYGSEDSTLYVVEVDIGCTLDLTISRTQFGDVYWLHDNRSFVYRRFPDRPDDSPPNERYYDSQIMLHRLGDDPEQDRPIFGRLVSSPMEIARADFPMVVVSPRSHWVIGVVVHGVQQELSLYAAPAAALAKTDAIPWRLVADVDAEVASFAWADDMIYLRTFRDAPRYRVIAASLSASDRVDAVEIISERQAVIEDLLVTDEQILVRYLDGGVGRIESYTREEGACEAIPLPLTGTIAGWASAPGLSEVLVQLVSWTDAPRIYRYDLRQHTWVDPCWCPEAPVDMSAVTSYQIAATAADGTMIPISIVHRRGLPLDGDNPTLLVGYGSYGISLRPAYSPAMLAWYERGGVYAVAHIRGGGEYGAGWHAAGCGRAKHTAIDDFVHCAEELIAQGYTRPARLAAQGTSAGGVVVGVALVHRPDLWGAVIIRVGLTNPVRLEACEGGAANISEFGSIDDPGGWWSRCQLDAYAQVQDGVAYPAVLLTASFNDARVPIWQVAKLAARLQAATASGRPVLLRVDFEGGHGFGASRTQEDEELADRLAFLLAQLNPNGADK